MRNDMFVELTEKTVQKAKEVANSMGMSIDEVVSQILEWYFEDCEKEK